MHTEPVTLHGSNWALDQHVQADTPQHRAQSTEHEALAQLSAAEREQVMAVLTSEAYADMSVNQVWAWELDEGRYWCSARTMFRILDVLQMSGDRRRQASHPPRTIPELVSTSPNEVWSWDITKLRGPTKRVWFHVYVVIDIFSRYVVGWRIEAVEDGDLAADLVQDIVTEQGTPPGYLHADGGAAMTSKALASLMVDLDVRRSHNRPRTSNDNPFSESQFKTMKYVPDYPSRFATIGAARAWMDAFTHWYNHEHRHSGIGLHHPRERALRHRGHRPRPPPGHPQRGLRRTPEEVPPRTPTGPQAARTRHHQRPRHPAGHDQVTTPAK